MKRKGLIVSSIVMVIVLIASLTTATYAWFSSSSEAKFESMNLVTKASTGLAIAALDNSSGSMAMTSGMMSWDKTNKLFKGATASPGSSLNFSSAIFLPSGSNEIADGQHPGFYSCSGDGAHMFTAYSAAASVIENEGAAVGKDNLPEYIGPAGNLSLFSIDFCVFSQEAITDKNCVLVLDELTIDATGTTDAIKSIAASSRVALFAKTSTKNNTPEIVVPDVDGASANGVFCIEPYADLHDNGGTWKRGGSVSTVDAGFIDHKAAAMESVTNKVFVAYDKNMLSSKRLNPDGPPDFLTDTRLATVWGEDKYIKDVTGTFKDDLAADINVVSNTALPAALKSTQKNIKVGEFTKSLNCVNFKLVIWFEGEDQDCITQNAKGGGIQLTMKFGTDSGTAKA